MRKSNWIVLAVAAVLAVVLLIAWYVLGFYKIDSIDIVVALAWGILIVALIGLIMWAENYRREKMQLAFVGDGVVYNPERGVIHPQSGENEVALLERVLSGLTYQDEVEALEEDNKPHFRWIVRSKRFSKDKGIWQGEVVSAASPNSPSWQFNSREELISLLGGTSS